MLFDRSERFASFGPEFPSDLTERVGNVLTARCLDLLLIQRAAGATVSGSQAQNILASEPRNRTFQCCGASDPIADLPGDFRSEPRVFGLSHQRQRLLNLLVWNHAQVWRLLQFNRQPLAEGIVKHRIACLVVEVGEYDRVLFGQLRRAVQIEVTRDECGYDSSAERSQRRPASCSRHLPMMRSSSDGRAFRRIASAVPADISESTSPKE